MEILRTISIFALERKIQFVVIGGHAVNAYGISRHTGDLDIVVPLNDKAIWLELMEKMRYQVGQSDDRFSRFRPVSLDNWPIDIMYVNQHTFNLFYKDSVKKDFASIEVNVLSPKHLIFLKIHALKYFQAHRYAKDYSDLISLLRMSNLNLEKNELQSACEKYASIELFNKIIEDLKQ